MALWLSAEIVFGDHYQENYDGWNTVVIENFGTIKLPKGCSYGDKDGCGYFYNDQNDPVIIECLDLSQTGSNEACEEYQYLESVNSQVLPYHIIIGKCRIDAEGKEQELHYFCVNYGSSDTTRSFFVWDTSIDEKMVEKIARSYRETE